MMTLIVLFVGYANNQGSLFRAQEEYGSQNRFAIGRKHAVKKMRAHASTTCHIEETKATILRDKANNEGSVVQQLHRIGVHYDKTSESNCMYSLMAN